jgi:hypothetical protein
MCHPHVDTQLLSHSYTAVSHVPVAVQLACLPLLLSWLLLQPNAQAQFLEVKNAFSVLSDPQQRAQYDRKLKGVSRTSCSSVVGGPSACG